MLPESNLEEIYVKLHRIIPFSNVEGQGNRCSIFLQGCNINCLYCHNPETIPTDDEHAKVVSLAYILNEIKKSMPFIRGITVSGGEPTLHYKKLVPLFKEVRKLGLTCYLDSNGFFDFEKMKELIEVTDKFLFDIKGIGSGLEYLCFDLRNVKGEESKNEVTKPSYMSQNIENLRKLLPLGKIEEVRLVHIKGFYDSYKTVDAIVSVVKGYPEVLFKLIRVHGKGARNEAFITNKMPSIQEHEALAEYAKSIGLQHIVVIN